MALQNKIVVTGGTGRFAQSLKKTKNKFNFILSEIFFSCTFIGLDNPAKCKTDLGFVFFKKL